MASSNTVATFWVGLLVATGAFAQSDTQTQLERRLMSVETLIEKSSAAKQTEASGNADALARRNAARDLHKQAVQALQAGDQAKAQHLVDNAARTMVEAVRFAAPEQVNAQKDRRDFDARMESARALLDAQKRVAAEKGDPQAQALAKLVESLLQRASELAATGKIAEARKLLDEAYLSSKAAVANMRSGDTLVHSLSFASKEEEYRYELDRNHTHQMLIQMLLQEKRSDGAIDGMVRKSLGVASRLRKMAGDYAENHDFDAGIKTLEESTKVLVKAIRGAGVYIPG